MVIGLIDYGLGNLGSVENMFKRVGATSRRVRTPEELYGVEKALLPGVGAFDAGVRRLRDPGLDVALKEFAASGRPLMGICLGMQLLLDGSDEGALDGLGLIPGRSVRFDESNRTRVPHMGWNLVDAARDDPLLTGLPNDSRFYFVHSYRVLPENSEHVLGTTRYGVTFASIVRSENVMGTQFHPEKSHAFGMTIIRNFAAI